MVDEDQESCDAQNAMKVDAEKAKLVRANPVDFHFKRLRF